MNALSRDTAAGGENKRPSRGIRTGVDFLRWALNRRWLDRLALLGPMFLFALLPFHFLTTYSFPFYREAFAGIFFLTAAAIYFKRGAPAKPEPVIWLLAAWIVFIGLCYLIDPGTTLYNEDILKSSGRLAEYSPRDYIIRNLFLYLPLVALLWLRGLQTRALHGLLTLITLASPLSILLSMRKYHLGSIADVQQFLMRHGHDLDYNTYVPYLTFPFIAGVYLLSVTRSLVFRALIFGVILADLAFIIVSSSRQSLLFCLLAAVMYVLIHSKKHLPVILAVGLIAVVLISGSFYLKGRYLTENAFRTPRFQIMGKGLAKMEGPASWILGHGLSAVVYGGPHNNYIRMLQRTGLIGMLLTFLPFLLALLGGRAGKSIRKNDPKAGALRWFLIMALFYTLYHSFFGYPHEDAFQAPYVWLGLGLWLALRPPPRMKGAE
jgi:hypothetical protein